MRKRTLGYGLVVIAALGSLAAAAAPAPDSDKESDFKFRFVGPKSETASRRSPECRAIRASTTLERPPAASGSRPMAETAGRPSSINNLLLRSVPWQLHLPRRARCGRAPA